MLHVAVIDHASVVLVVDIVIVDIIDVVVVQTHAVPVRPLVLVLLVLLGLLLAAQSHLPAVVVPHRRLQSFLSPVEVGELVEDDGDGQRHHQGAAQNAAARRQLPGHRDGHHVPVAHRGHAHRPPPPAGRDGVQTHILEQRQREELQVNVVTKQQRLNQKGHEALM